MQLPLQPGDELVAFAEIEAYYQAEVSKATEAATEAMRLCQETANRAQAAVNALHSGGRLPAEDVPWIEMQARNAATTRWLRDQGYEPQADCAEGVNAH